VVLLVVDLREQNDELGRHGGRNHQSASLHHFYRHDQRAQVEAMLAVLVSLAEQIDMIDCELRRMARTDERLKALCEIFGIGPILGATIWRRSATPSGSGAPAKSFGPPGLTRSCVTPPIASGEERSLNREREHRCRYPGRRRSRIAGGSTGSCT
jgi:hypothetical protein